MDFIGFMDDTMEADSLRQPIVTSFKILNILKILISIKKS